tara:strand:- start:1548 stop:2030 length:483 start_codon:yes stop_codon:yes gene_type:complete
MNSKEDKTNTMQLKAQTALEYMMIVALTLGIIVPTTYLFFRYSSESNTQLIDAQINQIGRSMVETAETVYFSGDGSKIVLELNIPENIRDMNIISSRELAFNITTNIGESEAVFFSKANITSANCQGEVCKLGNIFSSGLNKIKFQSFNKGKQVIMGKAE